MINIDENILATERSILRARRRITLMTGPIVEGCSTETLEDLSIMTSDSREPITLVISSCGGDVFTALSIIRAIQTARKDGIEIIGQVYGEAMSAAFLILQACSKRTMGKYCLLMCHGVTTVSFGDIRNLESEQNLLKKLQADQADLISSRNTSATKLYHTSKYWLPILERNTPQFYGADEALKMGLIDEVE